MTTLIRMMDSTLDRVERIKQAKRIDENGKDISLDSFDIAFDHVSFAYENGNPILNDVSFSIPQGSMTAIVGPSGSGKTTITRLIARFWDVQDGSITVGGHDVKEFTCDSLLKNMSMVFQNVYLFAIPSRIISSSDSRKQHMNKLWRPRKKPAATILSLLCHKDMTR